MNSIDILVAFGGGIFGAAIGALAVFEFVGLLVIAMAISQIVTGSATTFIQFPFGVFGPHVGGFAAGVAATAYAAKKGKLASGRDITAGLSGLGAPDVLLVGGTFGAIGFVIAWLFNQVPAFSSGLVWTDTVALTVVISGMMVLLMFGTTGLLGKPQSGVRRCYPPQDQCWMPYHSRIPQLSVLGIGIGLMAGYLGHSFGGSGALLAFGISAFSLVFLHFNTQVPVSHHIALPTALAAAASGSLIWAAVVGIICALLGELISRLFLVYGDTHIDPPAFTIAIMTTLLNLVATIGFFAAVPLF
ncbi:permease [Candidatus Symbiopectobacterium sp. 'North America']|uniref:permease n=1 Tax=Candidatus Symbiopectobacterium sp. 'North America' TaxID=2794574 RepID=UPI0018CA6A63|nr:permease [Candidatus Symbiopectobacterium sp. 'North America']MBG6245520.1 permease [Candidatus Symbiopectobacterium sp. 'North America']